MWEYSINLRMLHRTNTPHTHTPHPYPCAGLFAFVPFTSKEDVKLYQHLEMFMRQECPNLCQRDHLSFRSYFQPVKDTIDGDLCERYVNLPYAKQKELADDVDRTPAEMMKKLEESRNIM